MKKRVLFFIHDLGQGGAEKVLVNLVNHLDKTQFDVSVISLFGRGINEQYFNKDIKYSSIYRRMIPANSKWMKLFSPEQLHKRFIKDKYDIEISFLEGPSARVISGCTDSSTKLICWIHVEQHSIERASSAFRSEKEARLCYGKFDKIVCVSESVENDFCSIMNCKEKTIVLYNVLEVDAIRKLAEEDNGLDNDGRIRLVAVGTLKESKGYARLLRVVKRLLSEDYSIHLYILGKGPLKDKMTNYIKTNDMGDSVTLLGYQTNPYKYIKGCDLFVCASFAEGFSTAASEALILGTAVCTVRVSGMTELLGKKNEFGIITENDENALYEGIKRLLDDSEQLEHYKNQSSARGRAFETKRAISEIEKMLLSCMEVQR